MHNSPKTIFDYINYCLRLFINLNNPSLALSLVSNDQSIILKSKETDLLVLKKQSIKLLDNLELNYLLKSVNNINDLALFQNLNLFFNELNYSIIGLNHLGIGYGCDDIEAEILNYHKTISKTNLTISEENSNLNNQRWFFVGDRKDWKTPLVELVLQNNKKKNNQFNPHFQIDIDTNLSFDQLEFLTDKYLKKSFFNFILDFKNYGTVLGMGKLMTINGIDIYLGLGTNLRNNKIHRINELIDLKL